MWLLAALPLTAPYTLHRCQSPQLPLGFLPPPLPMPSPSAARHLPSASRQPFPAAARRLPPRSPPGPPLPSPPAVVRTLRRILHPTAYSMQIGSPRPLGDRDVRIVLRAKHITHGVSWRGAQSEPERRLLEPEAPSCTTLAIRHASPRPSRYASCVQLSHDRRKVGAGRIDGWARNWPRGRPCYSRIVVDYPATGSLQGQVVR